MRDRRLHVALPRGVAFANLPSQRKANALAQEAPGRWRIVTLIGQAVGHTHFTKFEGCASFAEKRRHARLATPVTAALF